MKKVGDLKRSQAERLAFFCTFLPKYSRLKAGPPFNEAVDNADPAEILSSFEQLLEEGQINADREKLKRILGIAKQARATNRESLR